METLVELARPDHSTEVGSDRSKRSATEAATPLKEFAIAAIRVLYAGTLRSSRILILNQYSMGINDVDRAAEEPLRHVAGGATTR